MPAHIRHATTQTVADGTQAASNLQLTPNLQPPPNAQLTPGAVREPAQYTSASLARNRPRATLMTLRSDVRRRILAYAVLDTNTIEITTFRTPVISWPTPTAAIRRPFNNAVEDCRLYCWCPIRKHYLRRIGTPAATIRYAIALVNRQLAVEARRIIYGWNGFSFDNVSDMNTFVRSLESARNGNRALSDARRYLRDIRTNSSRGWNTS